MITEDDQETITRLRQQVLDLENKLSSLKWQIREKDEALHRKNLALDAYHHVWCNGGCAGGVHRFDKAPLTEDIVLAAERNTRRLREYYNNLVFRAGWKRLSEEEKAKIDHEFRIAKTRSWSDISSELMERFKNEVAV